MTALSSGNLYQPLLVGNGHLQRLDDYMWPTYHRVTLEQGGDHYAEFQVSLDHNVTTAKLENWFMNWIGCHFVESYGGRDVFQGYVHTLRLYVGGVMRQISLEDMWNWVQVTYVTGSGAGAADTAAASDAASIARYGQKAKTITSFSKSLGYEIQQYMTAAMAGNVRDQFLARHAWPVTSSGDVAIYISGNVVLEVYIQGYVHELSWYRHSSASTSTTAISTIVAGLIGTTNFVVDGTYATTSETTTEEAERINRLEYIQMLLRQLDYSWGCFAGRAFDITARDTTNIKYRRQAYGDRYGFRQGGRYVPEPLITPGGWLFTEDIFTTRPLEADLRDDPRTDWIASVDYSIDGVSLTNPDWAVQGLALTLSNELQETAKTEPQYWIERAGLGDRK